MQKLFFMLLLILLLFNNIIISQTSNWISLGPKKIPKVRLGSGDQGIGRTSCIRFDPDYITNQLMYVGAPNGGLWKLNPLSGIGWEYMNTDNLSNIGVADIAFDPTDSQIIYLSTGDPDTQLNVHVPDFASTPYQSRGIYKSVDKGLTWSTNPIGVWYDGDTTLGSPITDFWNFPSHKIMRRVSVNSIRPNEIIAIIKTNINYQFVSYIYKSYDSGLNWYRIKTYINESLFELKVCPNNGDVIYISGNTIYRSNDGGENWTSLENNGLHLKSEVLRTSIAVTSEDPHLLYSIQVIGSPIDENEFYVSNDNGVTFSKKLSFTPPSPQLRTSLDIDQIDSKIVLATSGNFISVLKLNTDWTIDLSSFPTHPDVHEIVCAPNSDIFYASTDGGIAISIYRGGFWENISDGLCITQIWSVATAESDPDILSIGTQDNGTNIHNSDYNNTSENWKKVQGGDGFTTVINSKNEGTVFHSDGQPNQTLLKRSNDFGNTWSDDLLPADVLTDGGGFPIVQHPIYPNVLFIGFSDLYKSENYGDSWTKISTLNAPNKIKTIALCNSKPEHIYLNFSETIWSGPLEKKFWYSPDGGNTWIDRSNGLQGIYGGLIGGIAVDPYKPNIVYVSFRSGNPKIMRSLDFGITWSGLITGLPTTEADFFNLITEKGSKNVYVAASNGVYLYNDDLGEWVPFKTNLPNAMVIENKINYTSNEIFAATYGRGAWKSNLACPIFSDLMLSGNVSSDKFIECQGYLTSTEVLIPNEIVRYRAVDEVNLNQGFNAPYGTEFNAIIHGCSSTGNSISLRKKIIDSAKEKQILQDIEFVIFPNPSNGIYLLRFINNEEVKTCPYSIFNRVGELIQVGEINEQTQKIDLRSSIPGIYFVSLEIDGKIIVKKLIKI